MRYPTGGRKFTDTQVTQECRLLGHIYDLLKKNIDPSQYSGDLDSPEVDERIQYCIGRLYARLNKKLYPIINSIIGEINLGQQQLFLHNCAEENYTYMHLLESEVLRASYFHFCDDPDHNPDWHDIMWMLQEILDRDQGKVIKIILKHVIWDLYDKEDQEARKNRISEEMDMLDDLMLYI